MNLGCGEDLVLIGATLAIKVSEDLNIDQINSLIELAGLFRHNLEIIRHQRIECEREKLFRKEKEKEKKTEIT